LIEIAEHARVGIDLQEAAIPVCGPVRGACELLGLDPLYVANEGRLVAFVPGNQAATALELMRRQPAAAEAAVIGCVTERHSGIVELHTALGSGRVLDLPAGEQMPRIC